LRTNPSERELTRKYGRDPITRNWNRLSELTHKGIYATKADNAEINYRIAIQQEYSVSGKIPEGFIPVGDLNY